MRELQTRKPNRMKNYDYSQNGAYFITICVKDRHELLCKITVGDDAHIVPVNIQYTECGEIVKKHIENISVIYDDVNVNEYVIMPNHVHMIIVLCNIRNNGTMWASSPTQIGIPQIIRSMKTMVTKQIGFSLWQRSYHDHIIRNEQDYSRIAEYIENNPANWQNDRFYKTTYIHT